MLLLSGLYFGVRYQFSEYDKHLHLCLSAEQEEKEKQRVLALRAEQEAAKTAKRRRDSSSRGSSSTKSEKVPGKKKVVHQDEEREERQERKKVSPSFPKEEKHKDFRLSNNHKKEEGRVKSKSVSSKLLPDAKAKPSSAPSFKELMNIAASNAGTSTSGSNTLINGEKEKCSPNVKLKAKAESHRENLKAKSEKSFKREPLPVKNERSSHKHQNSVREPVQQGKSHTGMKVKKKTFFTNTKDASKSESRGPKSRESSPESRGPKSRELSQESRGPKSRESSPKSSSGKLPNSSAKQSNLKRAPDNSGEKQRGERKGKVNREEIGKSVQQPVKRKGGWLDPPVTEPKRKPEDSAVRKNGAIKHVIKPNEKKSSTAGEMERSKEKKRGWLDPVPRNPPVGNAVQSESRGKKLAVPTNATMSKVNKATPPAAAKAKKQGWLDSERKPTGSVPPPAKGKKGGRLDAAKTNSSSGRREKGGWLDLPSAPRERSGGWLGSIQEPTETRPGGWLGGAVREPTLAARRKYTLLVLICLLTPACILFIFEVKQLVAFWFQDKNTFHMTRLTQNTCTL